jgi:hypothetical protein
MEIPTDPLIVQAAVAVHLRTVGISSRFQGHPPALKQLALERAQCPQTTETLAQAVRKLGGEFLGKFLVFQPKISDDPLGPRDSIATMTGKQHPYETHPEYDGYNWREGLQPAVAFCEVLGEKRDGNHPCSNALPKNWWPPVACVVVSILPPQWAPP